MLTGSEVATMREAMGLTQRELAELVGVSHGWISLYELGKIARPSVRKAARIEGALTSAERLPAMTVQDFERELAPVTRPIALSLHGTGWNLHMDVATLDEAIAAVKKVRAEGIAEKGDA